VKYYVGTSGWHYNHWREEFYPKGLAKSRWLEFYSEHFSTVEINNSFYHLPSEKAFTNWRDSSPPEFVFSVKVSQFITHIKRLRDTAEAVAKFMARAKLLEGKLGPLLYQLPQNMKRDYQVLEDFLKILPENAYHVFEFRHNSWFDDGIFNLLRRYNAGFCIYDMPGFGVIRDLIRNKRDIWDAIEDRVEGMLLDGLSGSLEMAFGVYDGYTGHRRCMFEENLREVWIQALRTRLESGELSLAASIGTKYPYGIYHTLRYREDYPSYNTPSDWQWLVPYLIRELRESPDKLRPEVARLFIRDMRVPRRGEGVPYDFDHEYFEQLCVEPAERAAIAQALLDYRIDRSENDITCQMISSLEDVLLKYVSSPNDSQIVGEGGEGNEQLEEDA